MCIIKIKYLNPVYLLMEHALRRGISLISFGKRAVFKVTPKLHGANLEFSSWFESRLILGFVNTPP